MKRLWILALCAAAFMAAGDVWAQRESKGKRGAAPKAAQQEDEAAEEEESADAPASEPEEEGADEPGSEAPGEEPADEGEPAAEGLPEVEPAEGEDNSQEPAAGDLLPLGDVDLSDDGAKMSYIFGLNIATQMKNSGVEVEKLNIEILIRGMLDVFDGRDPQMSQADMHEFMQNLDTEMKAKQTARMEELGKKNVAEGKAFLAANKKKPGVKTTKSGLQYKVLKTGKGKSPKETDTFVAHYKGTLIDGTPFDSSYDRGEPLKLPVTDVIAGWTEALLLMKVGDKWQLFIPSDLAYGPRGSHGIAPNTMLIFEMELLEIQ